MAVVKSFFDKETSTLTHIVYDPAKKDAVIIDPVMDFNIQNFNTSHKSVDLLVQFCSELKLHVHFILETHVHADHLSGAQLLKSYFPKAKTCIGREVVKVQTHFADIFDLGKEFKPDGSQFDLLYKNETQLDAGSFSIKALHTPGHTPACYTLEIENKLFTGDAIFAPDLGTGRCDFPGGDAKTLYNSIKNTIYKQAENAEIYFAHDYPEKRDLIEHTTLKSEKELNVRLSAKTSEVEFISARKKRDQELPLPRLFFPSLFVNITGGRLPEKRKNGKSYMCFPLNVF